MNNTLLTQKNTEDLLTRRQVLKYAAASPLLLTPLASLQTGSGAFGVM